MSERDGIEPYRNGIVHVMSEKCSTCVFRPGNLMNLRPGQLKEMVSEGVPFSCHQTLPYSAKHHVEHYGGAALCHGYLETHGDMNVALAGVMGVVKEVDPYVVD